MIIPNRFVLLLSCCLTITSCGLFSSTDSQEPSTPAPVGWRSAGLEFADANAITNGGGAQRMVAVGEYLFVMDAFRPEAPLNVENPRPFQWRIWQGKVGSSQWKQIHIPDGESAQSLLSFENTLVVGTKYTGFVWQYFPETEEWEPVDVPLLQERDGLVTVLGTYDGNLVVGITSYVKTDDHIFWMKQGDSGITIPGIKAGSSPWEIVEFDGYLYGIQSQWGLFRWKPGMDTLEKLPSPRGKVREAEDEYISTIGVHQGRLLVGYASYEDGLYRMEPDGSWISLTPMHSERPIRDAPRDIRVILSYQDRLIIAGASGSSPRLWAPKDSTCPDFGDWKIVDNLGCKGQDGCSQASSVQTWGMVGIGDTLYWSWWNFVLKIPTQELDDIGRRSTSLTTHVSPCSK
jgi:hypothetical protein